MGSSGSKTPRGNLDKPEHGSGTNRRQGPTKGITDSDEVNYDSQTVRNNRTERTTDAVRSKNKALSQCDVTPVSFTYLSCRCDKCDTVVELEGQTVLYTNKQCLVFSRSACRHERRCTSVYLDNDTAVLRERSVVAKFLQTETVYCKSSTTGRVYYAATFLKLVYSIDVETKPGELIPTELFHTTAACHGIACFDGGFALLVDVGHHMGLPPWQVQYVNTSGKITGSIYRKPSGEAVLTKPTLIASNYSETSLYVVDSAVHVLVFDASVRMLKRFDLGVFEPVSITSDCDGNMYYACERCLLQFDARYNKRVLLEHGFSDKMKRIRTVSWINQSKSLVITGNGFLTICKLMP